MSTRYAIVSNDEVINVINWDGEEPYVPVDGQELVELTGDTFAGVGWTRVNGEWVAPIEIDEALTNGA